MSSWILYKEWMRYRDTQPPQTITPKRKPKRTKFYLYVGHFTVRVPKMLWVISPLLGHTLGGN